MNSAAHLRNESPMMRHCPCGSCNTTERVHQAQATVGARSDVLISARLLLPPQRLAPDLNTAGMSNCHRGRDRRRRLRHRHRRRRRQCRRRSRYRHHYRHRRHPLPGRCFGRDRRCRPQAGGCSGCPCRPGSCRRWVSARPAECAEEVLSDCAKMPGCTSKANELPATEQRPLYVMRYSRQRRHAGVGQHPPKASASLCALTECQNSFCAQLQRSAVRLLPPGQRDCC